jgi:hypothetical protein
LAVLAVVGVLALGVVLAVVLSRSDTRERAVKPSPMAQLSELQARTAGTLVSGAELKLAGSGPAGALLRWWQLIQFSAPATRIALLYSPSAAIGIRRLAAQLRAASYYFVANKPLVLDESISAGKASVFALIGHGQLNASDPSVGVTSTPYVFYLDFHGSQWLLDDNRLLASRARASGAAKSPSSPPATRRR